MSDCDEDLIDTASVVAQAKHGEDLDAWERGLYRDHVLRAFWLSAKHNVRSGFQAAARKSAVDFIDHPHAYHAELKSEYNLARLPSLMFRGTMAGMTAFNANILLKSLNSIVEQLDSLAIVGQPDPAAPIILSGLGALGGAYMLYCFGVNGLVRSWDVAKLSADEELEWHVKLKVSQVDCAREELAVSKDAVRVLQARLFNLDAVEP